MANVADKFKAGLQKTINALTKGTYKLADPHSVESQVDLSNVAEEDRPKEWYETGSPSYIADQDLIALGNERYEVARTGRWVHNEDIFSGLSCFRGDFNRWWNTSANNGTGGWENSNDEQTTIEQKFYRKYNNVTRVLVERAIGRISADEPDAWTAPRRDDPRDKRAAAVGRSVLANADHVLDLKAKMEQVRLRYLTTTTTFFEIGWDNQAYADAGIPQPDGTIQYHRAQIGDLRGEVLLGIDLYPDPNAALSNSGIDGGAYVIKRGLYEVDFINKKWGKLVEPDAAADTYMYAKQRIMWIAEDFSRSVAMDKHCAVVTEVWEKPSIQYPDGRFWVYAKNVLLWKGKWPYKKKDSYPFNEFYFQENIGSVWHLNMVRDLMPLQMALNELETIVNGRMVYDCPVLLVPSNAGIAPDDIINQRYGQVISYDPERFGGDKPNWMYPPPPGNFYQWRKQDLIQSMEYLAGTRDFNSDSAPTINSGKEYELRMDQDKSRLGPVMRREARGVVKIKEWCLALTEEFGASFPRLLAISDRPIPQRDLQGPNSVATELIDLRALSDGQYCVVLQPGSGEGKTAAARAERLDEMVKIAMELPPPLAQFYFNESDDIRSDSDTDAVIQGLAEIAAQKAQSMPNPLALQQMQSQNQLQILQQKAQIEMQQQQADAQIEANLEGQKSAIELHGTSLAQTYRMQADAAIEHQRFINSMQLLQAKGTMPAVTLAGKLGPAGESSAQVKAGLAPDTAESLAPTTPVRSSGR